jgi:hypothetical protein
MQTIKNGRKRGCGSCGQSESYESMLLDKPVTHGAFNSLFRASLSVHNPTRGDIREVRTLAELSLDTQLAA